MDRDDAAYRELLLQIMPRSIRTEEDARRVKAQLDFLLDVPGEMTQAQRDMISLLGDIMLASESDHRFELG
jgi:hypothetical protein